jgi:hypothetical protein
MQGDQRAFRFETTCSFRDLPTTTREAHGRVRWAFCALPVLLACVSGLPGREQDKGCGLNTYELTIKSVLTPCTGEGDESETTGSAQEITDLTIDWDLTRRPEPE